MFDNIGGKIKGLAKIVCYAGIGVSIYFGVAFIVNDSETFGIIVIALGALASWVGSFVIYGFGELVENSAIIAGKKTLEEAQAAGSRNTNTNKTWICRHCETLNPGDSPICIKCGKPRDGGIHMGSHQSDRNNKSYWGDSKWQSGKHQNDNNE